MSKELEQKSLGDLIQVLSESVEKKTKKTSTVASRKEEWKKAVETFDVEELAKIEEKLSTYVDKITVPEIVEPRELTPEESKDLMSEFLSLRDILEFASSRKESIKSMVFASLTERYRELGEENPEIKPGTIEVPELGEKFCREGGGYSNPTLDQEKLKGLLSEEEAGEIFKEVEIPARVETVFDEDKLVELMSKKPELIEAVRSSLKPGKAKSVRFQVRKMK